MATLKNLKEKMVGVKKTAKVTRAMESLSAIKMRTAQKKALNSRYYAFQVFSIIKRLSKIVGHQVDEIFASKTPIEGKNIILLVSPDKGLTGGMNNFLFKKVNRVIKNNQFNKDNVSFVCVGRKGYSFVSKLGYDIDKYFDGVEEKSASENVNEVSEYLNKLYRENDISQVIIIFTKFLNTSEQKAVHRIILPVIYSELKTFIKNILPTKGKFSDEEMIEIDETDVESYVFEPSIETVIKEVIPFAFSVSLHHSLLESFASEHSARMLAMKNSTDKANELAEDFRKKYNKERQSKVTQEVSEIVSGIEAMKK